MSQKRFFAFAAVIGAVLLAIFHQIGNEYLYITAYTIVQYSVIATAWNILGGYTGYTNFGTAGFVAIGAYASVVIFKTVPAIPLPFSMLAGGLVAGLAGILMGYLTLRIKGVFFAIATLAFAIVLQTLVVNWAFVGGSRGVYMIRPVNPPLGNFVFYLLVIMVVLAIVSLTTARWMERSSIGRGLSALRDDEVAAEACGVPTLRLKLIATFLSGAFMGMAGGPLPFFLTYMEPASAFSLSTSFYSIAMPVVGGMSTWVGPLVGALLLGTIQQVASVTIPSYLSLLFIGIVLIVFVVAAPNGIVGALKRRNS